MANLKQLRGRITSVKSTQKITSAMKMVAASKLRKAQDATETSKAYADGMRDIVERIMASVREREREEDIKLDLPQLMVGNGKSDTHLLMVFTSDRGLCGGFNVAIVRYAKKAIAKLVKEGKQVKLLCVGRKGRDLLKRDYGDLIVKTYEDIGRSGLSYTEADDIELELIEMFDAGQFDICTAIYNRFISAITQEVSEKQIIPVEVNEHTEETNDEETRRQANVFGVEADYEFEPDEVTMLETLLPRYVVMDVFHVILQSQASEHGARMTSMDNATRNAGDMIDDLTLTYNRTRQAVITTELIEIISGAEAL